MARKKKHEEEENLERWLVSYADFITLLFAFFTVLYATSQQDVTKQKEFEESVRKYFSGQFGFGFPFGDFPDTQDNTSFIEPPLPMFPQMGSDSPTVSKYVSERLKRDMTQEQWTETVSEMRHDSFGVSIDLAAEALFPVGSAEIRTRALPALDKIGTILKESGRKILIEGHTDNVPISTSKFPSNWELASARATKIVRYFIQKHKIQPNQLVAMSYADQKPRRPNDTPENRAKNRRIEILIVTSESPI